jgi:transposase
MSAMDRVTTPVQSLQRTLFPLPEGVAVTRSERTDDDGLTGKPRLRTAIRDQVAWRSCCWNDLLAADHQARVVWDHVLDLDLSGVLNKIKSVQGSPGHPPADPRILVALWLYATLRGIGSARELDRRCQTDLPFEWLCGDVNMNYHTLADFRTAHLEFLDDLLTKSVAVLMHEGLVTLDRVAQDGMRVRASAGSASFHRQATLEEDLAEAKEHLKTLKAELESDAGAATKRQQAARERAARERAERLQRALEQLPEIEARKPADKKERARASSTDPEARVMKMANGGFNPAYNVELATDVQSQIITGVDVVNVGSDRDQLLPMIEQHQERYEETPDAALIDGGFVKKEDFEEIGKLSPQTTIYAPVPKPRNKTIDEHAPKTGDGPATQAWRARMATPEAQAIYKDRASTAECVNAIARNRGLQQFRVRGSPKVKAVVLWYVLAHNLMRAVALRTRSKEKGN